MLMEIILVYEESLWYYYFRYRIGDVDMKIAASILDCNDRVNGVLELNNTNINYIHLDVMDGEFVPNVCFNDIDEIRKINEVSKYAMDVHLMMNDPSNFISCLSGMNIEFITIHLEIDKDKKILFKSIKNLGYKVGLSIKPNTSVSDIIPYLDDIDLILVMSVEPGYGGQKFMDKTIDRIKELKDLIGNRNILIEVDGGINNETITKIKNADIAVVGSYITKSDNYQIQVNNLLKIINGKKNFLLIGLGIIGWLLLLGFVIIKRTLF